MSLKIWTVPLFCVFTVWYITQKIWLFSSISAEILYIRIFLKPSLIDSILFKKNCLEIVYYEQFYFNQIDNLTKGIMYPHFATKEITFKRKHETLQKMKLPLSGNTKVNVDKIKIDVKSFKGSYRCPKINKKQVACVKCNMWRHSNPAKQILQFYRVPLYNYIISEKLASIAVTSLD